MTDSANPGRSRQPADGGQDAEFVRLFGQYQHQIYIYLMSLLHDESSADDLFQETMLVLWREFDQYQPGTNFMAWSCTVALNRVRAWRKKRQNERLQFSDEFLEVLSGELDNRQDDLQQRQKALFDCIAKLPEHHRQLIAYRYSAGHAIEEIAQRTQKSVDAVYRVLSRIRQTLRDCASQHTALEEA
ncbi:sigma-70 family RNA polymerase sigma factor [Blastopirellula retiformator]|uniref:RNA polymerase sigma factor CarQ n=1 Tax=Blastopirellula retiformator TaxID=2527970 RepID=A0A5C5V6B6_9BACT|nr:sigma-70 family RNA polymerase sigma factor [Blastopirellula retiformator]TWT34134.1 RNA polymerase sigma factor CarQ [Blastopirellula retiformator]